MMLFATAALLMSVTDLAGILWRHANGESPNRFLVESTTGGVGFLDFDNDGLLDIFFVAGTPGSPCALYRNLGHGKFEDVSARAGIGKLPFYGMGVAAADYDNDGFTDLYITGYPSSALFHNNGNGTFTQVQAGVANQGEWGASAAWLDYDRDGKLDLFVANYVQFSYNDPKNCDFAGQRAYCAQTEYKGSLSRLFHNDGNGHFSDVSVASGIAASPGRALGVVAVDADGDGWIDLFVARDASPNLLLMNQRNGTFRDVGVEKEIAYNAEGVARSGMGVDAADLNGDGLPDFVVTNFDHESHALYLSDAKGGPYRDASAASGLSRFTQPYVGWGVRFADFNNDGIPDLLIANGHLHEQVALANATVSYREPPLLLLGDGKGRFENAGAFHAGMLGRGLATGDFDNDGAVDAVIANLNGKPALLRNTAAGRNNWVGIVLRGRQSNRDAIGARLKLGNATQWITGGSSFLSSHDRRIVFGLASSKTAGPLQIRWPNGEAQTVKELKPNQYNVVEEAGGIQAFWDKTRAQLAAEPLDALVEPLKEPLPYRKYRVTLRGLGGVKFRAYLGVPVRGESPAVALPAIVTAPGYGGTQQGIMLDECQRGYVVLQVFPRSQGESEELFKIDGPEKLTWHIGAPEGYYYQGAYADLLRAVDFLTSRPEVNPRRIGIMGTSQGGGFALAAAALDPRIRAVTAHVPCLCDMRTAAGMAGSLVHGILTKAGINTEASWNTLDYFDAARLAPELRAPTLVSAGGNDPTCPGATIRNTFDRIAGIKSLVWYPDLPHTTSQAFYLLSWAWMDLYLK